MIPALESLARPTPRWLLELTPADIRRGPGPWLSHLVEDALIYPGAGVDGSPVRQCNGVVHSFIFPDYMVSKGEILGELTRARRTGTGFAHHRLVDLVVFDAAPLVQNVDRDFVWDGQNPFQREATDGVWAVYESLRPGPRERFSFLFMGTEAIRTLAALFPERPPRALVIQEHGFGGNCWRSFSEKIHELSQRWNDTPEILILGPNHQLHQWCTFGQSLGTDVATESMHKQEREIVVLGEKARRLCRSGFSQRI